MIPPWERIPSGAGRDSRRGLKIGLFVVVLALVVGAAGFVGWTQAHHGHHLATSGHTATTLAPKSATTATTASSVPSDSTTTAATTTTTTRHASGPTAKAVANQFSSLLSASEADRTRVVAAAGELSSCTNLSGAESAFDASVQERQHLESTINGMNVGALSGGGAVKSDFLSFLRASAADDQILANWTVQKMSGGCSVAAPGNTAQLNDAATAAKATFVQAWNPIAGKYGLPSVSDTDI